MKSAIDRPIKKVPFSEIKNEYKRIGRYMYIVYVTLLGMISSVPLWIWVSWNVAWKTFLTSLFLFFVTNGAHNIIKKSYNTYREYLDKIDNIDYTK